MKRTFMHVLTFIFTAVIIIGILVFLFVFAKDFIMQKIANTISSVSPF